MASTSPQRWGTVFDRLHDPVSYTGVYAERMRSGPTVNDASDVSVSRSPTHFRGSTNTNSDETIRDIAQITRPYLNAPAASSPTARAAERNRSRLEAAEAALFAAADAAQGRVDGEDRREEETVPVPLDTNTQLQLIFQYYCRYGRTSGKETEDTIDSFNFMKFVKECPDLLDSLLTPTEVDLIFVKCKDKTARRLTYGQFLDALSAMAAVRYHDIGDAGDAFSTLLAQHVFQCAASLGIAAALKSGMLRLAPAAAAPLSRSSSRSGSMRGDSRRASDAHAEAARTAAAQQQQHAAESAPRLHAAPHGRPNTSATHSAPPDPAAALLSAAAAAGYPHAAYPPHPYAYPWPMPYGAPPPGDPSVSFAGVSPPADVYEAMSRAATYAKMHTPSNGSEHHQGAGSVPVPPPMPYAVPWPYMMPPPPGAAPPPWPYAYPYPVPSGASTPAAAAEAGSPSRGRSLPTPSTSASMRALAQAALPSATASMRSRASSPRSVRTAAGGGMTASQIVVATTGGVAARPRSPRVSRSPSRSALGTPDYRPAIAGSANRPGGVHDRLASPASFTGVYRRAWMTDGKINHFTETGVTNFPSAFVGSTNTNSDETIHDIRFLLRPNLNVGKTFK